MKTTENQALLQRIEAFGLDDAHASFSFSNRLMRENGWDAEYTQRVSREYKRFMFLLCVCEHPCTPSDQVDQVWHLHLIYTYSYWKEFCGEVLGKEIHHGPTKGGKQEGTKYQNLYDLTLDSYRAHFGEEPPADIWLEKKRRFTEINYERVNKDKYWLLPKPHFSLSANWALLILPLLGAVLSAQTGAGSMMFYVLMALSIYFAVIFISIYRTKKKEKKKQFRPQSGKKVGRKTSSSNSSTSADRGSGCGSSYGGSDSDSGGSSFGGGDSGGGGSSGDSGCSSGCGGGCGGGGD
jgi:hypothetical protein